MGIEMALLATTALGAVSSIGQGQQQKKQYEMQAKQAEMEAQANITDRTRALSEAMAAQNAYAGASGRTVSSIASVLEGDKKRYSQDVALIQSGAGAQAAQYKYAGRMAEIKGYSDAISGLFGAGQKTSMLK